LHTRQITPDVVVIDDYSGRPRKFETRTDPERGTGDAFLHEEEIDSLPPEDTDNIFVHQLLSDSKFINRDQFKKKRMGTSSDESEHRATKSNRGPRMEISLCHFFVAFLSPRRFMGFKKFVRGGF
jgi:hypothetical protein